MRFGCFWFENVNEYVIALITYANLFNNIFTFLYFIRKSFVLNDAVIICLFFALSNVLSRKLCSKYMYTEVVFIIQYL